MAKIVTIQGVPVIDIYESFDGSYWFITEKLHKQDSVIHGKVYQDDQILFGYVKLSACPQFAEWGNVSETELRLLGGRVWKVPKKNWSVCPEIEVVDLRNEIRWKKLKSHFSSILIDHVKKALENKTGTGLRFGNATEFVQRVKLYRYE